MQVEGQGRQTVAEVSEAAVVFEIAWLSSVFLASQNVYLASALSVEPLKRRPACASMDFKHSANGDPHLSPTDRAELEDLDDCKFLRVRLILPVSGTSNGCFVPEHEFHQVFEYVDKKKSLVTDNRYHSFSGTYQYRHGSRHDKGRPRRVRGRSMADYLRRAALIQPRESFSEFSLGELHLPRFVLGVHKYINPAGAERLRNLVRGRLSQPAHVVSTTPPQVGADVYVEQPKPPPLTIKGVLTGLATGAIGCPVSLAVTLAKEQPSEEAKKDNEEEGDSLDHLRLQQDQQQQQQQQQAAEQPVQGSQGAGLKRKFVYESWPRFNSSKPGV